MPSCWSLGAREIRVSWTDSEGKGELSGPKILVIKFNSSSTVEPGNKGRPDAISKKIQPTPLKI